MKSRRNFIRKVAFAGATATLSGSLMAQSTTNQQLYHQVFFWLKEGVDEEGFIKGVRSLAKCNTVADLKVGKPAPTADRPIIESSYSVAILVIFDSLQDHDDYQEDPVHLQFIDDYQHQWSDVKIFDFFA